MSRALFGFILYFLYLTCYADQLIIEPEMGRAPLIKAMEESKQSVKLVMYGFTDETLLNSLIKKKLANKTVQVILEKEPYKAIDENKKVITKLKTHHIPWQGSIPPHRLIHQKTLLVDNEKVIVMTFNFTHSSFKNERNFGLIIDDAKRVKAINTLFSADWNHVPNQAPDTDLLLSPDNSRQALLKFINTAKRSIKVYAQSINDYKIVGALASKARKGVEVSILTSHKPREKQANYLEQAGVKIAISKHYYIHAKVIIVDNEQAVLGSINLTKPSFDNNRELAVITRDKTVISQLNNTFHQDWSQANQANLPFTLDERKVAHALKQIGKYANKFAKLLDRID